MAIQISSSYGKGDASFQAAGREAGIRRLVDDFYALMGSEQRFAPIYQMHPQDIQMSRDKLAAFLSLWLGGPRTYIEKYGSIGIPAAHQHLPITEVERDQWLDCMREAVAKQPFADDFKQYLMVQFAVPAQAIVNRCAAKAKGSEPQRKS